MVTGISHSTMPALRLAFHNLRQEQLRLGLSVLAIGLALMLILFLLGLRAGALRAAVIYLENAPGSVEVLPQGTKSTAAGTAQFISPAAQDAVATTPGVARVTPILLLLWFADLHGRKEVVKLIGYEPAMGGGPWDLAEGREPTAPEEAVLDRSLADRHGLEVGDTFEISGRALRIVGLSNATTSWTGSYAFAQRGAVESLVLAPGAVSFLLVAPDTATSAEQLATKLRAVPGVNVLLKNDVMANDQQAIAGIFDQVIRLMIVAAFVVGALVVAMIVYAATSERRVEYGILKAVGAPASLLYRVVGSQALVAAGLGSMLGVGLAFVAGRLVTTARPQFLVVIEPSAPVIAFAAGVVMALLGAYLPARAASRLAPADVFRR